MQKNPGITWDTWEVASGGLFSRLITALTAKVTITTPTMMERISHQIDCFFGNW
ncbi:MAG: hypothetical protein WCV85_02525 [Patescibacteria group bacterium]